MKLRKMALAVTAVIMLALCGCGSGNDLNGSLTIGSTQANSTNFSEVSFTVKYTNPQKSNLLGMPLHFRTSMGSFDEKTNNSGSIILSFVIPKADVDQAFFFEVTTGDLLASKVVIIPALGTEPPPSVPMSALPTSITFTPTAAIDSTQDVLILGGTGNYSVLNTNPSPNLNISAAIVDGTTLRVSKESAATPGVATILVVDDASPPNSVTVTVNY